MTQDQINAVNTVYEAHDPTEVVQVKNPVQFQTTLDAQTELENKLGLTPDDIETLKGLILG